MALILNEEQELLKQTANEFFNANTPVTHMRELRDTKDATGFSKKRNPPTSLKNRFGRAASSHARQARARPAAVRARRRRR